MSVYVYSVHADCLSALSVSLFAHDDFIQV